MSNNFEEPVEAINNTCDRTRVGSPRQAGKTQGLRLPKDRREDFKQHYERFVMTVYHTVKNNKLRNPDIELNRINAFNIPDSSFPKLPGREPMSDLDIETEI